MNDWEESNQKLEAKIAELAHSRDVIDELRGQLRDQEKDLANVHSLLGACNRSLLQHERAMASIQRIYLDKTAEHTLPAETKAVLKIVRGLE